MELERDGKIVVPSLPTKAISRQVAFWAKDDGIFETEFIEDRRQGLEDFINKCVCMCVCCGKYLRPAHSMLKLAALLGRIAGHPLAQNERCLHMFLQEKTINKNYTPGKIRA